MFRAPFIVLVSAMVLAACSSTVTPSIPVPTGSSVLSRSVPPYGGAPKVVHPLPDSVLSGSPCDALSPKQILDDVGPGVPGKVDDGALGPVCRWYDGDGGPMLMAYFTTLQHEGLSVIYKQVKSQMRRFDVLPPIQGFPAVAYDTRPGPKTRDCHLAVGLADTLDVQIGLSLGDHDAGKTDACGLAAIAADQVVTTLTAKAGH
ncbi:DUF3558 domain-containing protein [Amycolatopsis panacis]|uniref:DUF3558 domain-containing protein n=1 Tax=Amycolatopsis panacis TaxID=2340917 RepID=A0A419HSM1_9PSEU|nr:DUF3558 domain-containing protein [Amycolatopsis panacis]RJQ79629.1 DUF3558 domain-containing protein [Amycolatopsis panacis]